MRSPSVSDLKIPGLLAMSETRSTPPLDYDDRVAIAPPFYPITRSADEIQFRSGPWAGPVVTLADEDGDGHLAELPPLLDGRHSVGELLERFAPADRPELGSVIERLFDQGVLMQGVERGADPIAGYRAIDPTIDTDTELESGAVLVSCTGRIGPMVADDLSRLPLDRIALLTQPASAADSRPDSLPDPIEELPPHTQPVDILPEFDYVVYTTDQPGYEHARQINQAAYEHDTPWISARLTGLDGQVGPTVIPGRTACYECFYQRVLGSMAAPEAHRHLTAEESYNSPLRSHARVLAGWLVTDFLRLLSKGTGFTVGGLVHFDFFDMTVEPNPVLRLPRCPTCGTDTRQTLDVKRFVDYETLIEDGR